MTIYYVDPNAVGANNGSSWADAWTTIQSAFNALAAGDNCKCRNTQTLTTQLVINQGNHGDLTNGHVTFIGCNAAGVEDGTRFVIDGNSTTPSVVVIGVVTNYWKFKNIEFKRATGRGVDPGGKACSGWIFINCGFNNNGNNGIGQGSSYFRFCYFKDCEANNNTGSGFTSAYYDDYSFCKAIGNGNYGFYNSTFSVNYYGCISHDNDHGFVILNYGIYLKNCTVDGNTTTGLHVQTTGVTAIGCRITNNGIGINLSGSGRCCFEDYNVYYNNATKFSEPAGSLVFGGGNSLDAADTTEEGYTDRPNDDFNLTADAIMRGTEIDIDGTNKFRITAGLPPEYIDEAARNTDPGIANVIKNVAYKILNVAKVGTFDEAARNTNPGIALVIKNIAYKILNIAKVGTFDEAARNTDPGIGNVKDPISYKIENIDYVGTLQSTPTPNAPVISASGISKTENRVLIRFTANAIKYEVYHADDAQKTNIALLNNNVVKNYFVHSGLTAGTTRYYFVKAVNNNNDKSDYSVGVPATTLIGHPRKLIRDKVVNLITGNVTYNGNPVNIYKSRATPVQQVRLPLVIVYGKTEDPDHRGSFPRINWNDFDVVTQIIAEADTGEGGEDICNEISNQVEGILGVNWQGLGLEAVDELNYGGGGFRIDSTGEKKLISLIQAYTTRYQKKFPSENDQNTWGEALTDFVTQITDIAIGDKGEIKSETDLP